MTTEETSRATPRRTFWLVGALACAALVAAAVIAVIRLTADPDPDPDGRILSVLTSIEAALPHDATVMQRQHNEPRRDSCDGRPGTEGWSPVNVVVAFRSATAPAAMIEAADARVVAAGWQSAGSLDSGIGPGRSWTRTLDDGSVARAQLSAGTQDNGQSITWDLSASARPHGPVATGC